MKHFKYGFMIKMLSLCLSILSQHIFGYSLLTYMYRDEEMTHPLIIFSNTY